MFRTARPQSEMFPRAQSNPPEPAACGRLFLGPGGKGQAAMSVQKQQINPASLVFPILPDRPATLPNGAQTGNPTARRLAALLILIAGAAVPTWLAAVTARRP